MRAGESNALVGPIKATTHCDIAEHQKDHEIEIIQSQFDFSREEDRSGDCQP